MSINKYLKNPLDFVNEYRGETFIFFDTETTGLDPRKGQVVEIAAIAVSGKYMGVLNKFHAKIKLTPETLEQIQEEKWTVPDFGVEKCLELNRYHELNMKEQEEHVALNAFKKFVEKFDGYIVAQNAEFDMGFVTNITGPIKSRGVLDTMLICRMMFLPALKEMASRGDVKAKESLVRMQQRKNFYSSRLGDILKGLGIEIEGWHAALADVFSTIKAFKGMMSYLEKTSRLKNLSLERAVYREEVSLAAKRQRYKKKKRQDAR